MWPELGEPQRDGDRATVFEAIHCAFKAIMRRGPAVPFLHDLHWADATTLSSCPRSPRGRRTSRS